MRFGRFYMQRYTVFISSVWMWSSNGCFSTIAVIITITVNRLFMIFLDQISLCYQCQQNFNFLSIESQLEIRTAKFLQAFSATKNTLCLLFKHCAVTHLSSIFDKYKPNVIRSASQLARVLRYKLSWFVALCVFSAPCSAFLCSIVRAFVFMLDVCSLLLPAFWWIKMNILLIRCSDVVPEFSVYSHQVHAAML